jgi:hypothetical protein
MKLSPPSTCPKLVELAEACWDGACNVSGILRSLPNALEEVPSFELRHHPALKLIIGQVSFLMDESIGPSSEARSAYRIWKQS